MRNEKGFSLIEVLVATAILSVLAVSMMSVLSLSASQQTGMVANVTEDKMVSDIVEQVTSNPDMYQKYFAPTSANLEDALAPEQLPLAWSKDFLGPATQCPACPGRVGYVFTPLQDLPGLYMVTIRYTNSSQFEGVKDYKIVVGTR